MKLVTLLLIILTIMLTPIISLADWEKEGITDKSVKVGIFGPMSGPASVFAPAIYGAQIYYNEINKKGGIHGRKIEAVFEDDQCVPAMSVAAAKKLITQEKAFLLHGGTCTSAATAAVPYVAESKVPWVVLLAGIKFSPETSHKNIFLVGGSAFAQGTMLVDFSVKELKAKRIAVLRQTDLYGKDGIDGINKALKKYPGVEIVADETLEGNATDATAQILKIKNSNPDAVLLCVYYRPGTVYLRQAYELGLRVPSASFTALEPIIYHHKLVPIEALEGHYHLLPISDDPLKGKSLAWFRALYAQYYPDVAAKPGEPSIWAPYGYGTAMVVVEGLKRAGKDLTRTRFIEAMETIKNFETGVIPCPTSHPPNAHRGQPGMRFWTVKNGEIQVPPKVWIEDYP
jgi:branched-chain amino acid transport system substrate-binding protein